jgi:predicted DNA-binding protein
MIHSVHTLVSPLFTPTMYTEIESLSTHLSISKGSLIRLAVEKYLRRLDDENIVEN